MRSLDLWSASLLPFLLSFGVCKAHYGRRTNTFAAFSNVAPRSSRKTISQYSELIPTAPDGLCDSRFDQRNARVLHLFLSATNGQGEKEDPENDEGNTNGNAKKPKRFAFQSRVKDIARKLVARPLASAVPMPQAIAAILREATLAAVEEVEDVISRNAGVKVLDTTKQMVTDLVSEAFAPMEASLVEMEESLARARLSLKSAKAQSMEAIEAIQVAAIAQAEGAATAVAQAEKVAEQQVMAEIYNSAAGSDITLANLTFDDVDYEASEMAPPFLDFDSCLVPGEPVVRVEKAPENSRRIFAGIDIMASVDDVWKVGRFVALFLCCRLNLKHQQPVSFVIRW
jgi:hypothetical protein